MSTSRSSGCAVAAFVSLAATLLIGSLRGQCAPVFAPGDGAPGANGHVFAQTSWDPDGAGPVGPLLVIGGRFTVAGNAAARGVASYDPATGAWSAFGAGFDGEVVAVAVGAASQLIVAVNSAAPATLFRVMAWSGSSWTQLGGDFGQHVHCLLPLPNGDVLAGGAFTTIGGAPVSRLARWNGTAWSQVGAGATGPVRALFQMPNNDIVVGGTFDHIDGVPANCVARWDGVAWSPLGSGMSVVGIDGPYAFAVAANGDLIAAGFFPAAGGVFVGNVARWDGSAWSGFGSGIASNPQFTVAVRSVLSMPNGEVLVGGQFTSAGGVPARSIARWNGSSWAAVGPGFTPISALIPATVSTLATLPNGDVVAGGRFLSGNGQVGDNLSRWNGVAWSSLARGFNGSVLAIAEAPTGALIVGGTFGVAGGVQASRVARWDGSTWLPLGSGVNNTVHAAIVLPSGDVVVGGSFTTAGGVAASRVARWNGSSWLPMGSGFDAAVVALELLPNGDLVAGGGFANAGGVPAARLARWTGSTWVELAGGVAGLNATVTAMHVQPNGTLIVGGRFSTAGGVAVTNMAAWNGTTWSPLGSAPLSPYAITTALGGAVVCCHTSWASTWNGSVWSNLGLGATSNVFGVAGLPDGDVIVVGAFDLVGGPPYVNTIGVARWGPTGYSAVDGGLGDGLARVARVLANGDVAIGGEFQLAGGEQSPWFARIAPPCRAEVTSLGAGCAGTFGTPVLSVLQRAWLRSTFRARSTVLPSLSFVVAVTGFAPASLPLAPLLPSAPGCMLHTSPDLLDLVIPTGAGAEATLAIPANASLIGLSFHHQHVPIEVDPSFAIVAVTATNAVTLTIGSF